MQFVPRNGRLSNEISMLNNSKPCQLTEQIFYFVFEQSRNARKEYSAVPL